MLKTHEYNGLLKIYKGEELVAVFTEIYSNMVGALKILGCLQQFSDGELDEFETLETLEQLTLGYSMSASAYARNASSSSDAINRVLRLTYGFRCEDASEAGLCELLDADINMLVDAFAGLDEEAVSLLRDLAYEIVSNTAYILKYEFKVLSFSESLEAAGGNVEEADVDAVFYQYCKETHKDVAKTADEIIELSKQYKASLPVFDEYPEMEEEFERIVGANLADVDPEMLTLDTVLGVIKGDILPTSLYELFSEKDVI